MISLLHGTVSVKRMGQAVVDVHGVGAYGVNCCCLDQSRMLRPTEIGYGSRVVARHPCGDAA